MAHCPNCGKEVNKPSRVIKNYSFTIQVFNCGHCGHNFRVTINESSYMLIDEPSTPKIVANSK
jgi:transcription elongation factor Elf1